MKFDSIKKKIKKSFPYLGNFIRILLRPSLRTPLILIFLIHDFIITRAFSKSSRIHQFDVSKDLLNKINNWIENAKEIKDVFSEETFGLILDDWRGDHIEKQASENQIVLESPTGELLREIHNEIRAKIRNKVGSPFSIVNTKLWHILPRTGSLASTKIHRDGFWPGHMKVMIYPNASDEIHGMTEIEGKNYTSEPPGSAILFLNSDLYHRAIPGSERRRTALEITIFRSFVDVEQFHPGHPKGRHYRSIFKPYFSRYKLNKIVKTD